MTKTTQNEQHSALDCPLSRDALVDLSSYLLGLPKRKTSPSGENESVQIEFEEHDEEIGRLRIWDAEKLKPNGVRATFRNESRAMPVTGYDDGLADKAKCMEIWWDEDSEFSAVARLILKTPEGRSTTIGTVTGVDFGDDPTEPPVVTLTVTGEWLRQK